MMKKTSQERLQNSIQALLASKNQAVVYFTRRDLLGESVDPIQTVWNLAEPSRILHKQSPEGYWKSMAPLTLDYADSHADLIATFKAFRLLIEKYQFTRESELVVRAAEYIFTCQTGEGDFRGFIGNQYATYYTGYVLALLIQAGYAADPRVEKGMQWLLKMRQTDGGWTIPILTYNFDGKTMYRLTTIFMDPIEPDRTRPFSHNWTDMVLRAFAAHPIYRQSAEARHAGQLLKAQFFQPDTYSSYKAASYWTRFVHWWPNLLTATESLSQLGFASNDPDIAKALRWFFDHRKADGLWDRSYDGKNSNRSPSNSLERYWISLRICRMLKHFLK